MITRLESPLVDFNQRPIQDGDDPWTTRSAILYALVHPGQPKELVDVSIDLARTLEHVTDDIVDLGPEAEGHIITCCRNALHPLLYLRVREAMAPTQVLNAEPDRPMGIKCG